MCTCVAGFPGIAHGWACFSIIFVERPARTGCVERVNIGPSTVRLTLDPRCTAAAWRIAVGLCYSQANQRQSWSPWYLKRERCLLGRKSGLTRYIRRPFQVAAPARGWRGPGVSKLPHAGQVALVSLGVSSQVGWSSSHRYGRSWPTPGVGPDTCPQPRKRG